MSESKPPAQSPPRNADEKPRRKYCCLYVFLAAVCFFCLAILIGIHWLRNGMLAQLSPEAQTELLTAESTMIRLPDDWHQPRKPVHPDVVAYHEYFEREVPRIVSEYEVLLTGDKAGGWVQIPDRDQWTTRALLTRQTYAVSPIDDDQRSSFALLLTQLQPVIDATTSITARPDYAPEMYDDQVINFLAWQNFAKLMRVKAMVELADGQCSAALESAILPFRMTQRPAQVALITHLVAIGINTFTADSIVTISGRCPDVSLLHQALTLMTELRGTVVAIQPEHFQYVDLFTKLHSMARMGAPVDLKPQSLASLYRQYTWGWGEKYYLWLVDNLPPGDPRQGKARTKLSAYRIPSGTFSAPDNILHMLHKYCYGSLPTNHDKFAYRVLRGLLRFDPSHYLWLAVVPIFAEAATRAYVSQARFDLARLRLAQKLAIIEGKMDEATSPTASAQAVTSYINPMPLDPFTSATFPLSSHGQFYSVGPDKADNHGATPYDATNGTFSSGDIYFLPPKDPNTP